MSNPPRLSRRQLLLCATAPGLSAAGLTVWPGPSTAAANDVISVLYRKDRPDAPTRLDPAVQAATLTLENDLGQRGLRVLQPSAATYELMDRGPAVVVSFAPDAGFSMVFSAMRSTRPMAGMDKIIGEVILRARVFVGHSIVLAEEARGTMAADARPEVREFAEKRSLEQAAQSAARRLADTVARRLLALTPADVDRYSQLVPGKVSGTAVALPTTQAPAPAPAPVAAPPVSPPPASPNPPATEAWPAPRKRFALVVAVSDYSAVRARMGSAGPGDLPGVAVDRRNLQAGLKGLGFLPENITVLADAQATGAAVREHLGRLVATATPDDLVFIAFAAHGAAANFAPSGFGMPVLSDFTGRPGDGALDFWQLQSLVGNLPARRTVLVVDTCHSGGVTGMMVNVVVSSRGLALQPGTVSPEPERIAQAQAKSGPDGNAFAILAAARPEESSLEDGGGGGLFTTHLLKALAARRGQMPLEQVFREHVEKQVITESRTMCQRMRTCTVQTPMFAFKGAGNMIRL